MAEWLEWQMNYLLDNYDCKTNLQIAKHVNKSEAAIAQKLSYLKIRRSIKYLEVVRDSKKNALRMLYDEMDGLFSPPPKEQ